MKYGFIGRRDYRNKKNLSGVINVLSVLSLMKCEKWLFWILEEDYFVYFWLCIYLEMVLEKCFNNVSGVCFFV